MGKNIRSIIEFFNYDVLRQTSVEPVGSENVFDYSMYMLQAICHCNNGMSVSLRRKPSSFHRFDKLGLDILALARMQYLSLHHGTRREMGLADAPF